MKDYHIHVTWRGQGSKQAFGGGNLAKMNNGTTNTNTKSLTSTNLKGFAGIGLAFRMAQMGNEVFGAYTEDRLKQRQRQVGLTFVKYGVGIALNPVLGSAYMLQDLSYRSLQYTIGIQKQNREADYYKRLSGNNANSGSRYRGNYA